MKFESRNSDGDDEARDSGKVDVLDWRAVDAGDSRNAACARARPDLCMGDLPGYQTTLDRLLSFRWE